MPNSISTAERKNGIVSLVNITFLGRTPHPQTVR